MWTNILAVPSTRAALTRTFASRSVASDPQVIAKCLVAYKKFINENANLVGRELRTVYKDKYGDFLLKAARSNSNIKEPRWIQWKGQFLQKRNEELMTSSKKKRP